MPTDRRLATMLADRWLPPALFTKMMISLRNERFAAAASTQGLTLVHFSAQFEPSLTQKHTLNTPNTPYHPLKHKSTP